MDLEDKIATEAGRRALVVVDMQNGFISPWHGTGVDGAQRVLQRVNAWIDTAIDRGWPVFLTRDIDPFGHVGEEGAFNGALHPALRTGGATVVEKGPGQGSGFSGFVRASAASPPFRAGAGGLSELQPGLAALTVTHVLVVGLAADVCVATTAVDAVRLGYEVTIDLAATAFVHADPRGDAAVVEDLRHAGVVLRETTSPPPRAARSRTTTDDGRPVDVVVIGGGPAGLSAALSHVRARRDVVVLDAGHPRNEVAAHMHGVLGHDGLPPHRLLQLGRREVAGYGGRILHEEVAGVGPEGDLFRVRTSARFLRARRVLVASGATDELPGVPGLRDQWGRGVVVCPYCDGWEHREEVVGVLATTPSSVEQAQLLRQWSDRVTYFPHRVGVASREDARRLADRGIRVEPGVVEAVVQKDG